MSFRKVTKKQLSVLVPAEINKMLRKKKREDGCSLTAATTEVLCRGLGIEPSKFSLKPKCCGTSSDN